MHVQGVSPAYDATGCATVTQTVRKAMMKGQRCARDVMKACSCVGTSHALVSTSSVMASQSALMGSMNRTVVS